MPTFIEPKCVDGSPLLPVASHETFIGMLCVWLCRRRGNYGHIVPVRATIVALNPQGDRTRIAVSDAAGRRLTRSVPISDLRVL